jgi:hypothetical protein
VAGTCKQANELSCFIKGVEFSDWMSDRQFLEKDSAPCTWLILMKRPHGRDVKCFQSFGRKPERTRPLGRPRRRWEDNIIINLWEILWEGVDWMHGAQDSNQWWTVVNTVMNLRVTWNSLNG